MTKVTWGSDTGIGTSRKENLERINTVTSIVSQHFDENDLSTSVADIIGNLLHYCRFHELPFDECLERGQRYFHEEGGDDN